jgi:transcriptional regulator with XRE-family HTH domain
VSRYKKDLTELCDSGLGRERKELVARVMGCTLSTLAAICSGQRRINVDHLRRLQEYFPEFCADRTVAVLGDKRIRLGKLSLEGL